MTQSARLLIATMLQPGGDTGVQTHFNLLASYARAQKFPVQICTPFDVSRYLRKVPGALTRVLRPLSREWAALWYRWADRLCLSFVLRRALRRSNAGAVTVYAQDPLSASAALDLRKAFPRVRVVMVAHYNISEAYEQNLMGNTTEDGLLYRNLLRREAKVLPQLDGLVFPSDFLRQQVTARVPEINRIPVRVIPNFAPAVVADPTQPLEGDLISIGTLEPRKNQGFLIRVLAEANALGYRYRLTLVGRGPSMAEFAALAQALGVGQQVRFLGRVERAAKLLPRHRVYVHAALTETFGIVLVEAMSCGLPILAAPVGGIPEVFRNEEEGLYADLGSPRRTAECLIRLLESPDFYAICARSAKETYERRFSPEVVAPQWLRMLLEEEHDGSQAVGSPKGLGQTDTPSKRIVAS